MIFIPAIAAALTSAANAALATTIAVAPIAATAAGIGAVTGGATCAVTGAISGYHEHGELTREVAVDVAHSAAGCAAGGAIGGVLLAPAGIIFGPMIAPVAQGVDDVAIQAANVLDDVAKSAVGNLDEVAAAASGSAVIADNAASSFFGRARQKMSAATSGIGSKFRLARNKLNARFASRLPKSPATEKYIYVIEDSTTGLKKIGMTTRKPPDRLMEIAQKTKSDLDFACIIRTDKDSGLESILHEQFASQRTPHPVSHNGATEWFALTAAQVAAACSH